uniref:Glycosyltransferase family 25 LPS biosynthesis protein n=1 Tax=Pithovirus LCPAC302 TaxID=2506593 RepID=A0A481Z669_9VIRU|nr:MAG: glycosyltransferase family 25 LPS biosynthesis protein [Pithovirus LCPAC302]
MSKKFKDLWNYFDCIRCINLVSRPDRYSNSKKIFDKYYIPVEYYKTEKHKKGGEYGCFKSHINVIREAYYNGDKNILVFEDDIISTEYLTPKYLETAIDFMENEKWDIFYLGALPNINFYRSKRTRYKGIYKLKGICTHAYVLNRKAMKRLIGLKYNGTPIDYYYIRNFDRCFAIYPTMFNQGLSESDLRDNWWYKYTDKNRVTKFYRCIEWYAYYINYPIVLFVPILVLIAAWFICGMYNRYHWICLISLIFAFLIFAIIAWKDSKIRKKHHRRYQRSCKNA